MPNQVIQTAKKKKKKEKKSLKRGNMELVVPTASG